VAPSSGKTEEKRQGIASSGVLEILAGDMVSASRWGGNSGKAFISWGTLFFNFSCLAGDIGLGASIGDPERGMGRIAT
jgi:hypothetical protein